MTKQDVIIIYEADGLEGIRNINVEEISEISIKELIKKFQNSIKELEKNFTCNNCSGCDINCDI